MASLGSDVCAVCQNRTVERRIAGHIFYACPTCGYAQLASATKSHQSDYWAGSHGSAVDSAEYLAVKQRFFIEALEALSRLAPGRRLLDIGGGAGHFAQLALQKGWDAFTFDVSPHAADAAKTRLGADRVVADLSNLGWDDFDVVSIWCVIAHTRTPHAIIEEAARLLRPGGVLWITTPNFTFQRMYGRVRTAARRPIDFAGEDHIGHFTAHALGVLLERTGLSPPSPRYCGIAEVCHMTGRTNWLIVKTKSIFNRTMWGFAKLGLPNLMSELQVTSVKTLSME